MTETGAEQRRAEVFHALDAIHDPCSVAIGKPIGLVAMGIIDEVAISGGSISITVLPTFPDCLFRGVFEEKIESALADLGWCRSVAVTFRPADQSWDETRMSPAARERLGRRRVVSSGEQAA